MAASVEQAAAAVAQAQRVLDAAKAAAAAETKATTTPRAPEVILADLFDQIALRIGNRPQFKLLIAEYRAATKQIAT